MYKPEFPPSVARTLKLVRKTVAEIEKIEMFPALASVSATRALAVAMAQEGFDVADFALPLAGVLAAVAVAAASDRGPSAEEFEQLSKRIQKRPGSLSPSLVGAVRGVADSAGLLLEDAGDFTPSISSFRDLARGSSRRALAWSAEYLASAEWSAGAIEKVWRADVRAAKEAGADPVALFQTRLAETSEVDLLHSMLTRSNAGVAEQFGRFLKGEFDAADITKILRCELA